MFGELGIPELLIILAIVLVLFGPGRIAGMGQAIGEAVRGLRSGLRDDSIETLVNEPEPSKKTAA